MLRSKGSSVSLLFNFVFIITFNLEWRATSYAVSPFLQGFGPISLLLFAHLHRIELRPTVLETGWLPIARSVFAVCTRFELAISTVTGLRGRPDSPNRLYSKNIRNSQIAKQYGGKP